ncbi:MAG: exonuclease domain-containing protein [Rhodobacteraceae bacterium]|nr:exonuclease domain-containing protein [Paracoccaceae bacterium]
MRELILDTESTGLGESDRLIEIGIVEHIDGMPSGEVFHWFINPDRQISQEATDVHGITNDDLREKPFFSEIVDDVLAAIGQDILVMHNAEFDHGIMNRELVMADRSPLPDDQVIDTLTLARKALPHRGRHNLEALCNYYSINRAGRRLHSALDDAKLLSDIYPLLLRDLDSVDMIDLLDEKTNADARERSRSLQRPEPLTPRLTKEDIRQHQDYIRSVIGPDSVWLRHFPQDGDMTATH